MRVAIVQSNYLPWKGYFDLIASVDCFVLYDDVQFTKRDWRNRNRIKTPQGLQWLTVPVLTKNRYYQKINETVIDGTGWTKKHWRAIEANYNKAKHFNVLADLIGPFFEAEVPEYLSDINENITRRICDFLGIETKLYSSSDFELNEGMSGRLLGICRQLNADRYVSGPLAKGYLDEAWFESEGVGVEWFDYSGYPEYEQLWGDFEHKVSVIDLIANTGREAPRYMKQVIK